MAKTHQIRFRLGLRHQNPAGELTAANGAPQTPSWIKGAYV